MRAGGGGAAGGQKAPSPAAAQARRKVGEWAASAFAASVSAGLGLALLQRSEAWWWLEDNFPGAADLVPLASAAAWTAAGAIALGFILVRTRGQVLALPAAGVLALLRLALGFVRPERPKPAPTPTPETDQDSPLEEGLPPLSLLAPDRWAEERARLSGDPGVLARAERVRATLERLRIPAQIAGTVAGPAVTRIEFRVSDARAATVARIGPDVGAVLGTTDVRVVYPVPGKPETLGIEVPNERPAAVRLRSLLAGTRGKQLPKLAVALGRRIDGAPALWDLAAGPHLLIGGTTGSGKSTLLHAILGSLLFRLPPVSLQLILIDPKLVELAPYEGLPHTMTLATTRAEAISALRFAVDETDRRYQAFHSAGAKDLASFNRTADEPLPSIVIVIDEMAELLLGDKEARKAIEDAIQSLSQRARAAGIHLVVATQRPSVDVITGVIKANIPSRIALNVASEVESRVVLDQPGAETLVGRGDMLFLPVGARAPERIQAPLLTDQEVAALAAWWRGRAPLPEAQAELGAEVPGGWGRPEEGGPAEAGRPEGGSGPGSGGALPEANGFLAVPGQAPGSSRDREGGGSAGSRAAPLAVPEAVPVGGSGAGVYIDIAGPTPGLAVLARREAANGLWRGTPADDAAAVLAAAIAEAKRLAAAGLVEPADTGDEAYEHAVRHVLLQAGAASASIIQWGVRIRRERALAFLARMEEEGLVGPPRRDSPREVLVGPVEALLRAAGFRVAAAVSGSLLGTE